MREQIRQLNFVPVGHIVVNDAGALSFNLNPEFTGDGPSARMCGWVYIWAKVVGGQFDIVYVGKAGNTLRNRFGQHTSGFANSPTGRRHAERIRKYFASGNAQNQLHVYARKSPSVDLLGAVGISMCEAEERAMITLCLRRNIQLWNYQAASQRPRPNGDVEASIQPQPNQFVQDVEQNAEAGLPQIADEGEEEEQGVLSREDAFTASLSDKPDAVSTVAELLNVLRDHPNVQIHYTFTNGADLRIRCLARSGRDINVATISWLRKKDDRQGFVANLFIYPEAALGVGASEATPGYEGQPTTVRSRAFFEVPGAEHALVKAVLKSIDAFDQ